MQVNKSIQIIIVIIIFINLLIDPIVLNSINLLALQSKEIELLDGIEKYNQALYEEAIQVLEILTQKVLNKNIKLNAYLYLGLSHIALGNEKQTYKYFQYVLQINPDFILDRNLYSPKIISIFKRLRNKLPLITDFSITPEYFSPYKKKDLPKIKFKVSKGADISFCIYDSYDNCIINEKIIGKKGFNEFYWDWSDKLLNNEILNFRLTATDVKNNSFVTHKKVKLKIEIPPNLEYSSGIIRLKGTDFRYEKKIKPVYSKQRKKFLRISLIISILGGTAFYLGKKYKKGEICLLGFCAGLWGSSQTVMHLSKDAYIEVPDNESIKFNEGLKIKIKKLKEQIRIKQTEEETK